MCTGIVCLPSCDIINFEINFISLIKLIFFMNKKSRQKFKYLKNKDSFKGKIKSIFHHFKGLSVVKNCLRPENAALNF